jgi:putative transport protein
MNPFVLMFITVFTGLLFGKIKFGKFNFGISGTLFSGLFVGWLVVRYAGGFEESSDYYKTAQSFIKTGVVDKSFFILFLVLFVAAVGLLAAKDIGAVLKKYGAKFVLMGFIITFLGASATYGMTLVGGLFSDNINPYEVSGVYTGALTSSPGLAAAIETAKEHSTRKGLEYPELSDTEKQKVLNVIGDDSLTVENTPELSQDQKESFIKAAEGGIGVGHAIGYPFGVIVVILAVNFFPKLFRIDVAREQELYNEEMKQAKAASNGKEIKETDFDLLAFTLACFFGYTIGKFSIDLSAIGLGNFSLGATGGVLIGALILGHIGKIGPINFRMNSKILGVVRQLSLGFFLAIVGLRYGFKVVDALGTGWFLAVVSLVVGVVAMTIGFLIGRYVFKINWIMLSGAICGGMTSTPGLGAAVDAAGSDDPAAGYGATYPFALIGMVLFTIVLHNLPM